MLQGMQDAATLPPGPADAAALEYGRRLVREGRDRSAAFWAEVERAADAFGLAQPLHSQSVQCRREGA